MTHFGGTYMSDNKEFKEIQEIVDEDNIPMTPHVNEKAKYYLILLIVILMMTLKIGKLNTKKMMLRGERNIRTDSLAEMKRKIHITTSTP